jgi:hypothetical protein
MTKKEAALILRDRYDQLEGLASVMSDSPRFDWVGAALKAVLSGMPEALGVLEKEGEEDERPS